MKKIEIYLLEILLFISIMVFNFIYKNYYLMYLSIILLGIFFLIRFGLMKNNNYLKKSVVKIVVSCILAFFITIYLLGLLTEFKYTVFSFKLSYIFCVIILESIAIVMEELIRYIICRNSLSNKIPIIIYTIILSLLNIIIEINGYNLKDNEEIFIFITTVIIPIICREALCTYITYKYSYTPSIIFKLAITEYQFIFPIIPNLGNYLYAISNVALPFFIFYFVQGLDKYNNKERKKYQIKTMRRIIYIPVVVTLAVIAILVSGFFTNTVISVGSNSMKPTFERGDVILYRRVKIKNLKEGKIIAFKKDNVVIIHRIIKMEYDGKHCIIQTKGDANNTKDAFTVSEKEVLGEVKLKIKYIGYPTLWFNELLTGKEIN